MAVLTFRPSTQKKLTAFCVVDLRTAIFEPGRILNAATPEEAGELALGEKVNRHGQFPRQAACRVYWPNGGVTVLYRAINPVP